LKAHDTLLDLENFSSAALVQPSPCLGLNRGKLGGALLKRAQALLHGGNAAGVPAFTRFLKQLISPLNPIDCLPPGHHASAAAPRIPLDTIARLISLEATLYWPPDTIEASTWTLCDRWVFCAARAEFIFSAAAETSIRSSDGFPKD